MSVDATAAATARRTGATLVALATSELVGKIATFAVFLILARLLGVAGFGVLSFGISLGVLLGAVSSLGLDARVVQVGSARLELVDRLYGALVEIRAALCVLVMVPTGVVLFVAMTPSHALAVTLMVGSCLLDTFCDASRAACAAHQRQHLTAVVLVVERFVILALTVVALSVHERAWCAALGYAAGTCVGVVGMHLAARRAGARLQLRDNRAEWRMILEAAAVLGLGTIAGMAMFRIDSTLIGIILGTTAVGVYGANYRVFETVLFVSWSLQRTFTPVIAGDGHSRWHVRLWTQRYLVIVCAIYAPYSVLLALRGTDLVTLLFGAQYADRSLMVALAAAPLLFGIANLGTSVILALRPAPVVMWSSVAALVVNLALNLWLIPVWGITAAAVVSNVSFLVEAVILMRAVGLIAGNVVPVRPLLAVVLGCACSGAVALLIGSTLAALAVAGVVYLVVAAGTMHLIAPDTITQLRRLATGQRVVATERRPALEQEGNPQR